MKTYIRFVRGNYWVGFPHTTFLAMVTSVGMITTWVTTWDNSP
jgi:hypothetical protein